MRRLLASKNRDKKSRCVRPIVYSILLYLGMWPSNLIVHPGKAREPFRPLQIIISSIPDIASNIIVSRSLYLVECLFRFWSSSPLEVTRFGGTVHESALYYSMWFYGHAHVPLLLISPPSSTGISRLSPAPDAADPIFTSPPGYLFTAASSMPDSVAVTINS